MLFFGGVKYLHDLIFERKSCNFLVREIFQSILSPQISQIDIFQFNVLTFWPLFPYRLNTIRKSISHRIKSCVWYASTSTQCRDIWLMAVEQHQFYLDKKQASRVSGTLNFIFQPSMTALESENCASFWLKTPFFTSCFIASLCTKINFLETNRTI